MKKDRHVLSGKYLLSIALAVVLAASCAAGCTIREDYDPRPVLESLQQNAIRLLYRLYGSAEGGSSAEDTGVFRQKDGTLLFSDGTSFVVPDDIPEYSGEPSESVNEGVPWFTEDLLAGDSREIYGDQDELGRCTTALACIGADLMPTVERGSIGMIRPTGWKTARYDFIDGMYLYNRCHLIGYQLTGENDNERNLITGTRYMNVEGMLPFENQIADYINGTDLHVLYRVTPVFAGSELLARGVLMEAESVEDRGSSILFNVFCFNVQPGVTIDYATGDNCAS